jgi:hypothetical protein
MAARHHTVPQHYLRNFADASGQIRVVDRDDLTKSFDTTVRKVAAERGFYRIEAGDLALELDRERHNPEAVEAALSAIEGAVAPTIQKVVEGGLTHLTDNDWYQLIQFATLQTVRGNRWRNDFAALATHSARASFLSELDDERVRVWLTKQRRPADPESVANFRDSLQASRFPRVIPPQALLVQESLKMAFGNPDTGDTGLGRFLAEKKIELIRTSRTAVLTSDEPVCWWSPGKAPIGYATAQIVWIPLSPRLILQFREPTFQTATNGLPSKSDALATVVNRLVAAQAERWIMHLPTDIPLDGVQLPKRELWGDELAAVHIDTDGSRHETYLHRRLQPHNHPE